MKFNIENAFISLLLFIILYLVSGIGLITIGVLLYIKIGIFLAIIIFIVAGILPINQGGKNGE